jgi:hypothetical protein
MNRLDTNQKWGCGSIAVVALVICGAVFLLPRLFGGGDNTNTIDDTNETVDTGSDAQSANADIDLGDLVLTEQIDSDGCPTDSESSLSNTDSFYVVAPDSSFPEGTTMFVRLYEDGVAVEDLPLITANQDYGDTCVNFVFETVDGSDFDEGEYEAELWVNGNSYSSIRFNID